MNGDDLLSEVQELVAAGSLRPFAADGDPGDPSAWHHGWSRSDFDRLAGAVVAGHVIECSAQATGRNYSFFHEIPGYDEVDGRSGFGFPWADVAGTRSGDKGGDANLGIYARTDEGRAWLDNTMTADLVRELLPETADLVIERYRFPAIRSLNFVVRGLLEEGVAASTRQDPQAKALGEWLRAKIVPIPTSVLDGQPS